MVATRWKVEDKATLALMTNFIMELSKKQSFARALTEAQRTLIQSGDKWSHPFFWGGVMFVGFDTEAGR